MNFCLFPPPPPTSFGEWLLSVLHPFLSPSLILITTVLYGDRKLRVHWVSRSWPRRLLTTDPFLLTITYPHPASCRDDMLACGHILHHHLWHLKPGRDQNISTVLPCISDLLFPARVTLCLLEGIASSSFSFLLTQPENLWIPFLTSESYLVLA